MYALYIYIHIYIYIYTYIYIHIYTYIYRERANILREVEIIKSLPLFFVKLPIANGDL